MSAATTLEAEVRAVASFEAPVRARLAVLIRLQARARELGDPAERRAAELTIWRAALPLLEAEERPVRPEPPEDALPGDDLTRELRAMAARRARREALVPRSSEVPIDGPPWAARIVDTGEELLAIHRDTGTPYPVELFRDLDAEASAAIVGRRVLAAGGTPAEVRRLLEALGLEDHQRARLERQLREVR